MGYGSVKGQPVMADYYPILARAVSRLAINNAQARQEVYERVRTVLAAELSRQDPQKSTLEILRERSSLETAIRRVEAELLPSHTQTPKGQPSQRRAAKYAEIAADGNQSATEPAQPEEIAGSEKWPPERKQTSPESVASKGNSATQSERQPSVRYFDRAYLAEIFADSISSLIFDGETLRVEFGVTRVEKEEANSPITARRYSVCRLVLPVAATVELINRMQQITPALTQAGVMKAAPQQPDTAATKAG